MQHYTIYNKNKQSLEQKPYTTTLKSESDY